MSRIRNSLIAVLLVAGTACQSSGEAGLPEASERERRALAAFHAWTEDRTSARKDRTIETRDDHGTVSRQETTGLVDYRARTGRTTGTYTYRGSDGTMETRRTETILNGEDQYIRESLQDSPKPWRIVDADEWTTWTDYERALTYVHDEGAATVRGRPASKFTGMVDMLRERTITRLPRPDCPFVVLAIDLYLDETTGTMLRYDLRTLHPTPATGPAAGHRHTDLTTYTDFGVPVPTPALPDPDTVQPRFDPKPGTGITVTAEATAPPGC